MSEDIPGVRVVAVHKRDGLHRNEQIPDAEIAICQELPSDLMSLVGVYATDGQQIADLLWDMLPGGTIDQLLMQLMERRAALLRVGFLSVREIAQLVGSRCGADCSEAHTYDDGCLLADPHGARPDRKRPGHVHDDDCPAGCDGSDVVG